MHGVLFVLLCCAFCRANGSFHCPGCWLSQGFFLSCWPYPRDGMRWDFPWRIRESNPVCVSKFALLFPRVSDKSP